MGRSLGRRVRWAVSVAAALTVIGWCIAVSPPPSAGAVQRASGPSSGSGGGGPDFVFRGHLSGSRPPGTGKLTSRLYQLAHPAGEPGSVAARLAPQSSIPDNRPGGLQRLNDGRVVVDIRLTDTSSATQAALARAGAAIVATSTSFRTVTATVTDNNLGVLEKLPQVLSIREDLAPLRSAAVCNPFQSEGDAVLHAVQARQHSAVDGAGVRVGILSDSFNQLGGQPSDVARGALPGPGNPCGYTTAVNTAADTFTGPPPPIDEGRAMAQSVYSLAPSSSLIFETAALSDFELANNITDLWQHQHANVLVDDATYFDEPFYQDGPIAAAANAARFAGVPLFSAAGNNNITLGGDDVASLEALQYHGQTTVCATGYLDCHNFDPNNSSPPKLSGYDVVPGGVLSLDLQWAQPWGGVTTRYDLFIVDSSGNVLNVSSFDPIQDQIPFQLATWQNKTGSAQTVFAVVARASGPPVRFKMINLTDGAASVDAVQFNTTGGNNIVGPSIFGHNGAGSVFSVAAADWTTPSTPEPYSSHGPVTILFEPFPSTTPLGFAQTVNKPDFTAVDCTQTSFFGPPLDGVTHAFCGTSDAAPHAAAVAALLLEARPCKAPAQVGQVLQATSTPLAFPNTVVGSGLLNADAAVAMALQPGGNTPPGCTLFQRHADGSIWHYVGRPVTGWAELDNNPATVDVRTDGTKAYQLHSDGTIWQYTGTPFTGWALLDRNPAAVQIAASGGNLYQLHRDGTIWKYVGTPITGWALLDTNPAAVAIVADGNDLYQLHNDGSIWNYVTPPITGWQLLDHNPAAVQVVASGGNLYQLHRDGTIWKYVTPPITGWQLLDHNSAAAAIVADGNNLYQLHRDGSIWKYVSPPIVGWALLDSNPAAVGLTVGQGNLYQLHNDGTIWQYVGPPIQGWAILDSNPATNLITSSAGNTFIPPPRR